MRRVRYMAERLGCRGVCKESPSWQTGRSSACANIFRVRFLRLCVENSTSRAGDEETAIYARGKRGESLLQNVKHVDNFVGRKREKRGERFSALLAPIARPPFSLSLSFPSPLHVSVENFESAKITGLWARWPIINLTSA